ncbi:MAG: T9SS type A sorting domain-containing protein [Flavobacteriales bacterium]|nr:T9SS type A sorting domain-containing protein [Flavobacteriales bacterium]
MTAQAQFVKASLPGANRSTELITAGSVSHPNLNSGERGGCSNLSAEVMEFWCIDLGNGLVPSIFITFNYDGSCLVTDLTVTIDGGTPQPLDVSALEIGAGGTLLLYLVTEESTYDMTYTLDDGTTSDTFTYVDDGCGDDPLICDCTNTEHTIGVTTWLGDGFGDDGTYTWDGNPVDFNCMNWAYDCGDIDGTDSDPYYVCTGGLPPSNGCDISVEELVVSNLVSVYPNPSNGQITIANQSVNGTLSYRVIDNAGRIVLFRSVNTAPGTNHQVQLDVAAGSYTLEVLASGATQRERIIVE